MSDFKNYEIDSQGKEMLKQIEDELPRLISRNHDSHGNREYEPNSILDAKVRPLLVNLQLSQHLGYTVWRISNRITIQNKTGPGYLNPIRVSGSPSLNPGGQQQPGWYTYYPDDTELTPELDCIFVAKRRD
ncbi:hypothetical protein MMC24_006560 [Lignoscripta atroalba]|nr:hypothetical protein [Lignoscripta atroalba]